jgi:hypothetical protein
MQCNGILKDFVSILTRRISIVMTRGETTYKLDNSKRIETIENQISVR